MATLLDSYSEANRDADVIISAANYRALAQAFTAGASLNLDSCKFYLKKTGSPPGTMYAKLYSITGTYGTNAVPNTLLATSTGVAASAVGASLGLITFNFTGAARVAVTSAARYAIVIENDAGDESNSISAGWDTSSPSHGGNFAYTLGGAWTGAATRDVCFYVYGEAAATTAKNALLLGCG
jgi:hypothetical protein